MNMRARFAVWFLSATTAVLTAVPGWAVGQEPTRVRLQATSDLGIPLHAEPGDARVTGRLPDGTVAQALEKDKSTSWIKVEAEGRHGWITDRYVRQEVAGSLAEAAATTYVIGCWNLEHFHDGAQRGFPENTSGGPTYPPRSDEDYGHIATIIEDLGAKILVLSEVFAEEVVVEDEGESFTDTRSTELERLITKIDASVYDYVVGSSGESQHLAILYDTNAVELVATWETDFPDIQVEGKNLFDRQPLIAQSRLKQGGQPANDLTVVGVHLASGQDNERNHDQAMAMLQQELRAARDEGWVIPKDENDLVIMGDFNANRFDGPQEEFWDDMENHGWDVLADEAESYPPTRLSGSPLGLNNSRIDYIIVTKGNHGLQDEEVTSPQAFVHEELLAGNPELFRRQASDHLPVTIDIRVVADTDAGPEAVVGGSIAAAPPAKSAAAVPADADLARVVTAWRNLSDDVKRAILALVESADGQ